MATERVKVDPKHIADAAVVAAKANHYLIALAPIREEDGQAAYQLLIDLENSGKITEEQMDIATHLLAEAAGVREGIITTG